MKLITTAFDAILSAAWRRSAARRSGSIISFGFSVIIRIFNTPNLIGAGRPAPGFGLRPLVDRVNFNFVMLFTKLVRRLFRQVRTSGPFANRDFIRRDRRRVVGQALR